MLYAVYMPVMMQTLVRTWDEFGFLGNMRPAYAIVDLEAVHLIVASTSAEALKLAKAKYGVAAIVGPWEEGKLLPSSQPIVKALKKKPAKPQRKLEHAH